MSRGVKLCPTCSKGCGPRTLQCDCGHDFSVSMKRNFVPGETIQQAIERVKKTKLHKAKPRAKSVDNHKMLAPGDKIKIVGGGSYWLGKDDTKIRIGYKGRFVVKSVDQNGIYAYGNKKEGEQSMCYIWMGRNVVSKAGVHRRPHKVMKLNS